MKKFLVLLFLIYVGGYIGFRQSFSEVWEKDKASYVIFPEGDVGHALYYLWRPMSYIDGQLTGRGAHIGPHR
ncbi:MAG: hypothetical protein ABL893_15175 [Hyphomicrobium sp.]|nr:hypothetical protein [Hyphomicrobium sp.]